MAELVLQVAGLRVLRDGLPVVEDVSFALPAESDTALVGPNGAGKSTLVAAVLGLLPRQGRFPLTVRDFVGFGFDPPGPRWPWRGAERRRQAIERALERTQCRALGARLISELSGGQWKRVQLAFCVVRPRRLLVLDEAQAGLDAPSSERFHQLLLDLRRQEGWTVLQVSHDLEMVRRSCDQVLCLNRQLRCSGSPDHALSPQRLAELYGPGYVPYQHLHAPLP